VLRELRIRDVAIIEDLAVEFGAGFNVFSGETGAGKSIILGALGLILGARASAEMVRSGAESAEVQARVDRDAAVDSILGELDLNPAAEDEGLLLRRIVTRGGRSRAYIGDAAVPVAALRRLAAVLVDYASQHEHQVLLDEAGHIGILDRFGRLGPQAAAVADDVGALRALLAERSRLAQLEHEHRTREDYLRFQLAELQELAPQSGEQEELHSARVRLRNSEELISKALEVDQLLSSDGGSAGEALGRAVRRLTDLVAIDDSLAVSLGALESALIQVDEVGRDLADYSGGLRSDPKELQRTEDRLAALGHLARKHRCDVDELAAFAEQVQAELEELSGLEARLENMDPAIAAARLRALTSAGSLSKKRMQAATELSAVVEAELESLCMEGARFGPQLEPIVAAEDVVGLGSGGGAPYATSTGIERVRFLLGANKGEEVRALSKTASGGELSRILLALRSALAGSSPVQTCVFDEIDSGLGGDTAEVVAQKLVSISTEHQVICITHLPQIAARADRHFRVEKELLGGRTRTKVVPLEQSDSVSELVRMMAGGSTSEGARDFARELTDRARRERSDRMGRVSANAGQE
jgi:DNA repair protein RecN (Recombination protein N)